MYKIQVITIPTTTHTKVLELDLPSSKPASQNHSLLLLNRNPNASILEPAKANSVVSNCFDCPLVVTRDGDRVYSSRYVHYRWNCNGFHLAFLYPHPLASLLRRRTRSELDAFKNSHRQWVRLTFCLFVCLFSLIKIGNLGLLIYLILIRWLLRLLWMIYYYYVWLLFRFLQRFCLTLK